MPFSGSHAILKSLRISFATSVFLSQTGTLGLWMRLAEHKKAQPSHCLWLPPPSKSIDTRSSRINTDYLLWNEKLVKVEKARIFREKGLVANEMRRFFRRARLPGR
jgi:hypothetical protein